MARTTPHVRDGMLAIQEGAQEYTVLLESGPWWDWLNAESQRTFYFENAQGSFTARREYKHGGWYWYAYRKHADKLHKAYLGKSEALTLERLNVTAAMLSTLQGGDLALLDTGRSDQQASEHQSQVLVGNLLLMTKLSVPPARTSLIDRPRLIDQLARGLDRKLTLISAQAGFGKTSLLSQWVQESSMPVTWVSLDEADNDPVRFWSYIITALQIAHPTISSVPAALLHIPKLPEIEAALTALLNAINTIPKPFVLVLDDYHVIEAQVIHNSVAFLLDHLPTQMRLMIASRTDPPLPLARLRARNQLTELHAADLRFDTGEAAAFLNQTMDLQLPEEAIVALEKRTEGWIAGLHLAALSLQGQSDITSFIAAFTGSHRYIFDYLVDEVLDRQTETVQAFLLHTSILDRLCSPLCEAITDQPQAQALLEQLEQANLFMVALDDERHWYRYHQLFADVLRDRLQRLHPHMVSLLHRRAAIWYEQNNLIPLAVTHALAANDLDYAAQLIEQVAEFMLKRGEGTTLLRWIETLSEEQIRARPHLASFYAGTLIVVGQSDVAEARLQAIERDLSTNQGDSPDTSNTQTHQTLLGEITTARAVVAAYEGDVAQTIALAEQALAQLPESELFARSVVAASLGTAYWSSGDLTAADKAFTETRVISQAAGNAHASVASLAGQGYIQMAWGKLRRAAEIFQQAIQEATEPDRQLLPVASVAQCGLGELHYQKNELDKAEQLFREGIELAKQWGDPRTLIYAYLLLAHVRQAQGHPAGTQELMEQAKHLAEQHHLIQYLTTTSASQAWLCLKQGDLDAAILWADTWEPQWEARSRYSFDLVLASLVLVRIRIAQGQFQKVEPLLTHMLSVAEATGQIQNRMEALALQALAYQGQSNTMEAMRALAQALSLAVPEGYIRLFVDEGTPMATLLSQIMEAQQESRHPDLLAIPSDYLRTLLAAFGRETPEQQAPSEVGQHRSSQRPSSDFLSERELAVLRLVAAGLSNQEIAQEMVVAVSTVKWHLKNIYSILNVHNRAQAIKRAREIQLPLE